MRKLAGQDDPHSMLPCHDISKLVIGMGKAHSAAFRVATVGASRVVEIKCPSDVAGICSLFQFVYDVHITRVLEGALLFTKMVTISPRFVMMNLLS